MTPEMAMGLLPLVIGMLIGITYCIVRNEIVRYQWRKECRLAEKEGRRPPRAPNFR